MVCYLDHLSELELVWTCLILIHVTMSMECGVVISLAATCYHAEIVMAWHGINLQDSCHHVGVFQ
jgi:hypothetical protein